MKIKKKELIESLNKTFRKEQISRIDFDNFKSELKKLISKVDENESEEHLKYPLRDFLLNTSFYKNEINTKGRTDLAIYSGNSNKTPVNIIFETKKPKSYDFPTLTNINGKATHEAVLYYIRERYEEKNDEIKHIIITNVYEWFVFDAHDFEKYFYTNKIIKEYEKWKTGQKTSKNTEHFYKIVKQYIDKSEDEISLTFFDIRNYEKTMQDNEKTTVPLFKILSATHLLKLSYITDSNSLNSQFYNELLYIIGLTEVKKGSKKVIQRPIDKLRINGSLIENTFSTIKTENRLSKINDIHKYGETQDEQLLNISLELTITWINRILFLKLLEAQLISFHKNEKDYKFLVISSITNFSELNELFFDILAKQVGEREDFIKKEFKNIPYLNSSLFEISKLEDNSVRINSLKDRLTMPVYSHSVLTDRKKTNIPTLKYLFDFLNAYNFTNEGADEIQEENKTLINASVLGLIFEKINGYKEGSFFTPGYITMYMSRETIRRSVIQKFKEAGYSLSEKLELSESFNEVKTKIENRKEANKIINSIKIIDPAVGSGHFLVSALNEIIAIKSELDILSYQSGKRILDFKAEVVNDDLIITNHETEEIFEYTLNKKGNIIPYKQVLQEAIFNEKQTIIENCLFGVDINPNSVSICRLRLWIELLKHTFYTKKSNYSELETLPNIDINIKQGNSLISNFGINGNGLANGQSQKIKLATQKYKDQVILYKSTDNKKVKKDVENKIAEIKDMFSNVVRPLDKDYKLLKEKEAKLGEMPMLFTQADKGNWEQQRAKLQFEIEKLNKNLEQKRKTIYQNAFEWRFEFPEVLDENGNFIGFDVVIGNPPYISFQSNILAHRETEYYSNNYQCVYKIYDTFALFIEKAMNLIKTGGLLTYICPSVLLMNNSYTKLRKFITDKGEIINIINCGDRVFDEAVVPTIIFTFANSSINNSIQTYLVRNKKFIYQHEIKFKTFKINAEKGFNLLLSPKNTKILNNFDELQTLDNFLQIREAIKTGNDKKFISKIKRKNYYPIITGKEMNKYYTKQTKFIKYDTKNLSRPTKLSFYQQPKLFIRRVGSDIRATFDDTNLLSTHVLYIGLLKSNKIELKYLLALLNSKLINWIYNIKYPKKGNVFPEIRIGNLRTMPVLLATKNQQNDIIDIVDKIMKQKTDKQNTTKLENKLDKIVYKLYGLSKSEITEIETFYG